MKHQTSTWRVTLKWHLLFFILVACVERITFNAPPAQLQTVVEGMISDSAGPYTVFLSQGLSLDATASVRKPIQNATIKLFDDLGNVENLKETKPGEYATGGIIRGQVGHAYHITVQTQDGKSFESDPETLLPVGAVDNIKFSFEARLRKEPYGEVQADVFNILVDADAGTGDDNYVRWRFKGTYKVFTVPSEHYIYNPPYTPYRDPLPCSGYILLGGPFGSGGILEQRGDCTCCTCWVNEFETLPQLSDVQLVSGNKFKNIKIGEVPINGATFYEKYLVEVEQMSLSKKSFEFFKLVRAQKESNSSIFQPPSGEIKGNVKAVNFNDPIIGIFWATSIQKKSIFIYPSDIPYPVPPIEFIAESCLKSFSNSSNVKPELWP